MKVVDETLDKILHGISDEEIGVGSRVIITYEDGKTIEGRVWRMKRDGFAAVNRDGYAAECLFKVSELKHISVGTYGKLEKQQWLLRKKIAVLKQTIAEQMNRKETAIILSLNKGIPTVDAKSIIKSSAFQMWYKNNNLETIIPLNNLQNSHEILICSMAREYILSSTPDTIYNTLVVNNLLS